MKQFFLDLLSDSSGLSMMRFLSLICVLCACFLALYKGDAELNTIISLLSAGFGGKFAQKVVESGRENS